MINFADHGGPNCDPAIPGHPTSLRSDLPALSSLSSRHTTAMPAMCQGETRPAQHAVAPRPRSQGNPWHWYRGPADRSVPLHLAIPSIHGGICGTNLIKRSQNRRSVPDGRNNPERERDTSLIRPRSSAVPRLPCPRQKGAITSWQRPLAHPRS